MRSRPSVDVGRSLTLPLSYSTVTRARAAAAEFGTSPHWVNRLWHLSVCRYDGDGRPPCQAVALLRQADC
jgi:hypothetical protein